MKRIILSIISVSLIAISSLSHAANAPLSPPKLTLNNLSSASTCSSFANAMADYLETSDSTSQSRANVAWFRKFAKTDTPPTMTCDLINNDCVNKRYFGEASGCRIIAVSNEPVVIFKLYEQLYNAYNSALANESITANSEFGLSGNNCKIKNNKFYNCDLDQKI